MTMTFRNSKCIWKAITSPAKFVERLERASWPSPSPSSPLKHATSFRISRLRRNGCTSNGASVCSSSNMRILALVIHRDSINMALVSPPPLIASSSTITGGLLQDQYRHHQRQPRIRERNNLNYYNYDKALPIELPSIATPQRRIHNSSSSSIWDTILDIVMRHNVCGFVVSWPLERDTGKMGAKCGRVWYILEALQQGLSSSTTSSSSSIHHHHYNKQQYKYKHRPLFSCQHRPICLWDPHRTVEESQRLDPWGRSPEFARTSMAKEYRASKERYYRNSRTTTAVTLKDSSSSTKESAAESTSSTTAASAATDVSEPIQLWQDFCHAHWPEAMARQEEFWHHHHQQQEASSMERSSDRGEVQAVESATAAHIPQRSKHLFVDRQLQLAVAAAG